VVPASNNFPGVPHPFATIQNSDIHRDCIIQVVSLSSVSDQSHGIKTAAARYYSELNHIQNLIMFWLSYLVTRLSRMARYQSLVISC
jgi:hypothetical protein